VFSGLLCGLGDALFLFAVWRPHNARARWRVLSLSLDKESTKENEPRASPLEPTASRFSRFTSLREGAAWRFCLAKTSHARVKETRAYKGSAQCRTAAKPF
jgi:hypothetical protein